MSELEFNKNNTKFFWLAIAILGLITGSLAYLYIKEKGINAEKKEEIEVRIKAQYAAKATMDSLGLALNLKIDEIKKLGGDVASLENIKKELEADRLVVSDKNALEIKTLLEKIKNYQKIIAQKDNELNELRKENGDLTIQNKNLGQENTTLKTNQNNLADSLQKVGAENKKLSDRANAIAAALHAETINVYAISSKGKVKEATNVKTNKIEKLRLSFYLSDNLNAKVGEKQILVRILEPNGAVIADAATGSGQFEYNQKEMIYTAKYTINYTNNHQLVDIVYSKNNEFKSGNYTIELYCEGFKIGLGGFSVK